MILQIHFLWSARWATAKWCQYCLFLCRRWNSSRFRGPEWHWGSFFLWDHSHPKPQASRVYCPGLGPVYRPIEAFLADCEARCEKLRFFPDLPHPPCTQWHSHPWKQEILTNSNWHKQVKTIKEKYVRGFILRNSNENWGFLLLLSRLITILNFPSRYTEETPRLLSIFAIIELISNVIGIWHKTRTFYENDLSSCSEAKKAHV